VSPYQYNRAMGDDRVVKVKSDNMSRSLSVRRIRYRRAGVEDDRGIP